MDLAIFIRRWMDNATKNRLLMENQQRILGQ
jgi:hypothetical protein